MAWLQRNIVRFETLWRLKNYNTLTKEQKNEIEQVHTEALKLRQEILGRKVWNEEEESVAELPSSIQRIESTSGFDLNEKLPESLDNERDTFDRNDKGKTIVEIPTQANSMEKEESLEEMPSSSQQVEVQVGSTSGSKFEFDLNEKLSESLRDTFDWNEKGKAIVDSTIEATILDIEELDDTLPLDLNEAPPSNIEEVEHQRGTKRKHSFDDDKSNNKRSA